jgi:fumarylacetoacetase
LSGAAAWIPIPDGSPFPLENLPLGIGATGDADPSAYVAVGDHGLRLVAIARSGLLDDVGVATETFERPALNEFLAGGRSVWQRLRDRLTELLTDPSMADRVGEALVPLDALRLGVPVEVGDYVDFYSSIHHATNLGRLFRPDGDPLPANWRHLPAGYHGRSGSIVASGTPIRRPNGLRLVDGEPVHGPTEALDIELEVGFVIGRPSSLGAPVGTAAAADHIAGLCLVNDWSARDIQAYEYVPLGPFLGKSFATSVSPWLVSIDALEPYRTAAPSQDPPVADHLRSVHDWGFDLRLEVWLESEQMRAAAIDPIRITCVGFADMYWTPDQQLAHATANGAAVRAGDLFASGTVSGPTPGSEGSLIELTSNGERPFTLPTGETRRFLADGDRVVLVGWAGGDHRPLIGLGQISTTIGGSI